MRHKSQRSTFNTHHVPRRLIPAIRVIPSERQALKSECQKVENILMKALDESGQAYRTRRYGSVSWKGSNGSVSHMIEMSENMAVLAYEFYMDITLGRRKINLIHVISPQNGAIFVIKFLAFFTQLENRSNKGTKNDFFGSWNTFPLSKLGEKFSVHPIFQSLTLLQPSLPTPTFFGRLLYLPPLYCFTKQLVPLPEVELIRVFTNSHQNPIYQNVGINIDRAFVLPLDGIEKELSGLRFKAMPSVSQGDVTGHVGHGDVTT